MIVRHVLQKHTRGCGPAVLAMVTGHEYDDVCAALGSKDWNERGAYWTDLDDYLSEHGYASACKRRFTGLRNRRERDPWPCLPFADVHIAQVEVTASSPCSHFVVLLGDGTVLDPLTAEARTLASYHTVHNVTAIYRVGALP